MRINLTTDEFVEVTITSGTLQNISPQASVEVASTATKNTGIILPPYATLSYSDNATVYARNAWDDDSTCVIAVEPFKRAGEGGEYTLPIATASKLGGVKVGGGLDIDESGVLSAPVTYSTTEQQIGTWIDGKPLYQKTLTGTIAEATAYGEEAWTRVDLTALNISQMVNMDGVVNQVYGGDSYTMQMVGRISATALSASKNVDCVSISYDGAIKELDIINSALWANDAPFYATIRYTKTTD